MLPRQRVQRSVIVIVEVAVNVVDHDDDYDLRQLRS